MKPQDVNSPSRKGWRVAVSFKCFWIPPYILWKSTIQLMESNNGSGCLAVFLLLLIWLSQIRRCYVHVLIPFMLSFSKSGLAITKSISMIQKLVRNVELLVHSSNIETNTAGIANWVKQEACFNSCSHSGLTPSGRGIAEQHFLVVFHPWSCYHPPILHITYS